MCTCVSVCMHKVNIGGLAQLLSILLFLRFIFVYFICVCVCAQVCVCMYANVHVCTDTYVYRSRRMLSITLCLIPLRQALLLNLELAVFQLVWWPTSPSDFPVSATVLSMAGVTAACDHTQSLYSARNINSGSHGTSASTLTR